MNSDVRPRPPTTSVALCTYNGGAFLRTQLESILAQSQAVDEIVISDDASSDNTIGIAREVLAQRADVRFLLLRNDEPLGVTANFEQAIRATNGDVVLLSDQDDVWHIDRAATAVRELVDDTLLHFSDARLIDATGRSLNDSLFRTLEITADTRVALGDGRAFRTLLRRNLATGATVAFRRTLLEDALPFPTEWVHDEWLTILAAARDGLSVSSKPLIDYRLHGANQIGVVDPTMRRKISRVLQPRADRNRDLAERSKLLLDRLHNIDATPAVIAHARRKADVEKFRAALPANRARRVGPVLRRAVSGDYQRYCSQGAMDIVRDLLQPA